MLQRHKNKKQRKVGQWVAHSTGPKGIWEWFFQVPKVVQAILLGARFEI